MEVIGDIFYFLIALVILIVIHELGHFLVARLCGVYVERFSFGFGKVLFSVHDKKGTEYSFSLIPLGGYVKMYGEDIKEEDDKKSDNNSSENNATATDASLTTNPLNLTKEQSFAHKKAWQKFLIVAAGPLSNIVLAFLLYCLVFMLGIQTLRPAVSVEPGSVAYHAGLRTSDVIINVGDIHVEDWEEGIYQLVSHMGDKEVTLAVKGNYGKEPLRNVVLPLEDWELEPDNMKVFDKLGFTPLSGLITSKVDYVDVPSAASRAGFRKGDIILQYGNNDCLAKANFVQMVKQDNNTPVKLEIQTLNGLKTVKEPLSVITKDNGHEVINYNLGENEYLLSYNDTQCVIWRDFADYVKNRVNQTFEVVVLREGRFLPLQLTPGAKKDSRGDDVGYAGIAPHFEGYEELRFNKQSSFFEAIVKGAVKTYDMSVVTFKFIGKFITGDISYKNVSGPIGIAKGAGMTARIDVVVYLSFLALISVNLGIFNLLPIPVLDGAHLVFYIFEWVRGKPLPYKVMKALINIGLLFLLVLMGLAIFNDLYYRW